MLNLFVLKGVNIESEVSMNGLTVCDERSGMLFAPSEHSKVQVFFVPLLGPAPVNIIL